MLSCPDFGRGDASRPAHRPRTAAWWARATCEPPEAEVYRIGMLIPTSGTAGIWGPSCLACARLAAEEWNAAGGVEGRRISLTVVDASDESTTLEDELQRLVDEDEIEAIVGMHTSSVRERVIAALPRPLPFVYTPLYEGGTLPRWVMAIGETPQRQLLPAVDALTRSYRLRRWFLIGNDYCWPRRSHALVGAPLAKAGSRIVGDRYVPIAAIDAERMIDEIRRTRAQAVLMSLVGQDAVEFNRAFGEAGLAGKVLRLSCAVEENGLLAIGPERTEGLFVSSAYFATLQNDRNGEFRERYWSRFGERAPVLNALGQSTYEGVSFLRGFLARRTHPRAPIAWDSVRSTRWRSNSDKAMPIYLAEAEGLGFRVLQELGANR